MARTYLPILKWKRGEQSALQQLDPQTKAVVLPMAEVVNDYDAVADAATGFAEQVAKYWGQDPIFVDLAQVATSPNDLALFLQEGRQKSLSLMPVLTPNDSQSLLHSVRSELQVDKRGACLRITEDDAVDPGVSTNLQSLIATLGVSPSDIDILIDLGVVNESGVTKTVFTTLGVMGFLPLLSQWRSVTVAASAFPKLLSHVGVGVGSITRAEWLAYQHMLTHGNLPRRVAFGDYCISHPIYEQVSFTGSANIRYTIDGEWLVFRGRSLNRPQFGQFSQFHTLAAQLVKDPRYCGSSFSWGDGYIDQCASQQVGTGNLTTWRQVGTNHHITFVANQLATLHASSGGVALPSVGP